MNREEALARVKAEVQTANIVKHMLAAEAAMRAVARRLGEDEDAWGLAGLLHDLDYERTKDEPSRHGRVTLEMLAAEDLPAGVGDAILAHNAGKAAATPMEKALLAVDPATGFIVACALMHPEKKIAACDVPFLVRRFGEKRFAAGASREQMALCSELGLSLEEFLAVCLEGMAAAAPTLGL